MAESKLNEKLCVTPDTQITEEDLTFPLTPEELS